MRVDKSKWEKSSIVDSCDIQLGTRIVKKQAEEGCFSVYGGGGATFTTNTYNRENAILISRFALSKECTRFISGKFYLNDSGLTLVPKNESLNFDFLKWQIFSLNDKIYELARGAAQKNLDMKRFPLLSILVPTLSEQQAIVSELDAIQKMIDGYKAQIADLDTLVQSIFLDMFGDPMSNPKGWKKESLNKYASIGTGATPSRKIVSYYEGNIPWVKSTEVHNSYILETHEHITQEAIDNSNCSIYLPNTILVAMYGQGKTRGQVGLLKIEAATNQACAAIRCKDSLDPIFCYWHFQMCYEANRELGNGTNQKNMNLTIVGNIKFIIPSLALQQQFASKVEAIEKQKEQIRLQLKDAETLMAERMQYYFS